MKEHQAGVSLANAKLGSVVADHLTGCTGGRWLEVHTPEMWELTTQMATDAGRTDLVIRLRDRTAAVVDEQT